MRGVFDEEATGRSEHGQDRELTLGSGALLALFFGLVVLCGICFGSGYALGHSGPQTSTASATRPTPDQEPLQASGNLPKPSAIAQTPVVPPDATAAVQTAGAAPGAAPGQVAVPVQSGPAQPAAVSQPQVHPALASGGLPQPYASTPAQPVHSAISQSFMVQIAAVSNPEDANVLLGALRKRNYPVMARREPGDNLIHVRIGPFATQAIAQQWRMKLLNDGYNAEVQP